MRLVAGHTNIEFAGLTDVGIRRSHNQDSYAILPATDREQWHGRGYIFLVADGMGAHAVGELASKLAADSIPHLYSKYAQEGAPAALRRSFIEANSTIHNRGQANRDFEGMGTTSSALVLRPEGGWIGHVGDSRIYRLRGHTLEQLSFDHSLVWEMARRQKCNPDELRGIPSNVIIRSLGPEPLVQVDVEGPHTVLPGDIFILCSDGLSGPVSDKEIGAVAGVLPPAEACQLLIDLANLHGGPDNITAIVVRVSAVGADSKSDAARSWSDIGFARGKPWYERLPWPILSLLTGTALAVAAILLTVYRLPGGMFAYICAALSMLVGLAGLVYQFKQEKTQERTPVTMRPPKVYRAVDCTIELALLEKLIKAQATLEERIREHGWHLDWEVYRRHQQQVKEWLGKEELVDAFRESCRAMRMLTETIQRQRNKEESFQPLWEKRSAKHS